ncbi:MAG: metal-sensing transcriptional repressor [Bacilli bacterium]|jgi:DNA-binding FrmR family transcriptional regulator|nr:metal-sensing transcriptional repressor [Bacilli bacterium]
MRADHKKIQRKLSIAKGQLEGIGKMIDEDAYCIDVSNQILAVITLLKHANNEILSAHLAHCVHEAKEGEDLDSKMEEVSALLDRMTK